MITLTDVFSEANLRLAMQSILNRPNRCGIDGIEYSDFSDYWKLNGQAVIDAVYSFEYVPGPVRILEIVNSRGKRRRIASMNATDQFLCRAIMQVIEPVIDKKLSDSCFSYRKGRSALDAANLACSFIQSGKTWVGEADVAHFFDSIPRDRMLLCLNKVVSDHGLISLIKAFIYQSQETDGNISCSELGLIQGSPLSPVLSNLYLSELDMDLTNRGISFYRYGDDINVYEDAYEKASSILDYVRKGIRDLGLSVNTSKGGVFLAKNRKCLGYEFVQKGKRIHTQRVVYKKPQIYRHWTKTSIKQIGKDYHLINDGVPTKRDYTVLFENENGKYYLPVEAVNGLNIYSSIIVSGGFFEFMNRECIPVSFYNRYGEKIGTFLPQIMRKSTDVEKAQISFLNDEKSHLKVAKKLQNANVYNMRAVLRYYQRRRENIVISQTVDKLTGIMAKIKKLLNLKKELESVINPKKDQVAIYELDSYRYTSKHLIGYHMSQDNIL